MIINVFSGPDHRYELCNPMAQDAGGKDCTGQTIREAFPEYEILERHSVQVATARAQIDIRCDDAIEGHWDRFRIEQVFINLLTNALKYGEGKPIEISAALADGDVARVQFKDKGRGIAKENQQRIFERFERAIHVNEVSGLGLGLYIARQIVSLHHGTIAVESEIGRGSIFTVELPLH